MDDMQNLDFNSTAASAFDEFLANDDFFNTGDDETNDDGKSSLNGELAAAAAEAEAAAAAATAAANTSALSATTSIEDVSVNSSSSVKTPAVKKKRKLKAEKKGAVAKKPRKANNQRKNIKKIITEKDLNKSTLQALQEEQERQQRFQEYKINNYTDASELLFQVKEEDKEKETRNEPSEVDEQQPQLVDTHIEIETTIAKQNESTDSDIILLDTSTDNNKPPQQQDFFCKNDDTEDDVINEDTEDDDCQIISDSEEFVVTKKPAKKGVHTDDELNKADLNGQVLVNMNHPPEDPNIFLDEHLAKRIKSHQIGGIRFLYDNIIESLNRAKNKNAGFGCILAHSMGLGKTFQIVSFTDVFLRHTGLKRVLCIVPINTIQNWFHEYNHWLPENSPNVKYKRPFKVFLLNDNVKTFAQRSDVILQWRDKGGILLIGYEMFRTFISMKACKQRKTTKQQDANFIDVEEESRSYIAQEEIREALLTPCLVVCDEGHRIKNNSANIAKTLKCIKTKRRVVLTGYPLQNNLIEYWCMVDFVRPSYLGTKNEFCNMFERPIMNGQCVDSTYDDVRVMRYRAHVLHTLLEGFVQRRGHDVFIKTLPPKQEYVILVRMTSIQKELYLAFMESIGAMIVGEKQNPLRAFAICCKIWNHPDVLYDFIVSNKDADVDLDLPEMQQQQKKCGALNKSLLQDVVADTDSLSNDYMMNYTELKSSKTMDYTWAHRLMEGYKTGVIENAAKLMIAFSLIEQSILTGDKILLFSQSLLTLNLIERFLAKYSVPNTQSEKWEKNKNYYRIDGSTSGCERERLINSFNVQNNGVWLFLLSTRAGCLGINLVGANRVIIFDASFNPCHDAQAVCRVYRYGQQKNSYIYRLITDNTMEKKIYDRQISKQSVSDRVVDEIQAENHFTSNEVAKLIHFVKEEPAPVDLTDMSTKYSDLALVHSCLQYQHLITKEPFKHESLLLDKKEYQLSNREKRDAFRHYEIEKRIPANYSKSAYAAAYFAKMSSDSSRSNPLLNRSPSSVTLSPYYNNRSQQTSLPHSTSFTNTSTPQMNPYYSSLYTNNTASSSYTGYTNDTCSNNMFSRPYSNSLSEAVNRASLNHAADDITTIESSPDSSDIQIIDTNSPQKSVTQSSPRTQTKDVTMHRFITTTSITIPSTNTPTYTSPKIIPAGEPVILLKTNKGCYLRTTDGKFYAIRNTSALQTQQQQQRPSGDSQNCEQNKLFNFDTSITTNALTTTSVPSASNYNPQQYNNLNNMYNNCPSSYTTIPSTTCNSHQQQSYNDTSPDFNYAQQPTNTSVASTTNVQQISDSSSSSILTDFNNDDLFLFPGYSLPP